MSKIFPDPFTDRGDDFWNFDNLVNEYEWERVRKQKKTSSYDWNDLFQTVHILVSAFLTLGGDEDGDADTALLNVTNTGTETVDNFTMCLNWFDASGTLIAQSEATYFEPVSPGCTVTLKALLPYNKCYLSERAEYVSSYGYEYSAGGVRYVVNTDVKKAALK